MSKFSCCGGNLYHTSFCDTPRQEAEDIALRLKVTRLTEQLTIAREALEFAEMDAKSLYPRFGFIYEGSSICRVLSQALAAIKKPTMNDELEKAFNDPQPNNRFFDLLATDKDANKEQT